MHRISISQMKSPNTRKLLSGDSPYVVELCVYDDNYNPIFEGRMTRQALTDALMGKTGCKIAVGGKDFE